MEKKQKYRLYDACFRIYKRGEMNTRPYTRRVRIEARNKKEAYVKAKEIAGSTGFSSLSDAVRITYAEITPLKTVKVAALVTFSPRTRIVVDVPEDMTVEEYANYDGEGLEDITRKARANILSNPGGYLIGENIEVEEDTEMPYDPDAEEPMANFLIDTCTAEEPDSKAESLASKSVPPITSYREAFDTYVAFMKRLKGHRFFVMKGGKMEEI